VAADPTASDLVAAARFFAGRDVFGLVWIDAGLIVRNRYGNKADFIAPGRPITDSVIPLIGMEEFILSLQHEPAQSLELPGVVIVTGADTQQRYNLTLYWSAEQSSYLLLIARASIDASLEIELLRHVRARLMAEAEIKAKSEELARANRDLEDFAAIISHDLKAPMRALQYRTDDVEAALAGARLEDVRADVGWIRSQARRMSSMLTSLLEYSSVGRKSQAIETVDTGALARAIVSSLPHGRGGIAITIEGEWPVIETLKAPLDLVLRNLTDNAIKHHDRPAGNVWLSCRDGGQALLIRVRDDGPGIAPEHAQAVFLAFRTLKTGDDSSEAGIGMGLAHVERTVESVGGSITLLPGEAGARGAAFEVAWPKKLRL
jgi:signal transduction histidine kinase